MTQLTAPVSKDDENKRPLTIKKQLKIIQTIMNYHHKKKKKSSNTTNQVQYRILQRGQPDELTPTMKKSQLKVELNTTENSPIVKSQRNRRCVDRHLINDIDRQQQNQQQSFSNLTNNKSSNGQNSHTFHYRDSH